MCNVKRCKKLKKEPCLYVVAAAEKNTHWKKDESFLGKDMRETAEN